jgi:zinc transport system ATP-binding protein
MPKPSECGVIRYIGAGRVALIQAESLSIIHQGRAVLDRVSLAVKEQDFVTIIGPNGAGKSLLIKAMLGLVKVNQGVIQRKKGLKLSYVPQRILTDGLMPLKAGRFMRLGVRVRREQIDATVALTGVADFLSRDVHNLSGGELQRLLLARALLRQPELLVLDEPAQNLDVPGQTAFYQLLEHIYKTQRISIVIVSHDLHLVLAQSRQVICLYHHICCSGKPHTITKEPEFVRLFGTEFAHTMAVYHHDHDHCHDHD